MLTLRRLSPVFVLLGLVAAQTRAGAQSVTSSVTRTTETLWTIKVRNDNKQPVRVVVEVSNCVEATLGCGPHQNSIMNLNPGEQASHFVSRSACTNPSDARPGDGPCERRPATTFQYVLRVTEQITNPRQQPPTDAGVIGPTQHSKPEMPQATASGTGYSGSNSDIVKSLLRGAGGWSCEPLKPPVLADSCHRDKYVNTAILQAFGAECYARKGMSVEAQQSVNGMIENLGGADSACGDKEISLVGAGVQACSTLQIYPCGTNAGGRTRASGAQPGASTGSGAAFGSGNHVSQPAVAAVPDLGAAARDIVARRNAEKEARGREGLTDANRAFESGAARAASSRGLLQEQASYSIVDPSLPPDENGKITGYVELSSDGCSLSATRSSSSRGPTLGDTRNTWTFQVPLGQLVDAQIVRTDDPQQTLPNATTVSIRNSAQVVRQEWVTAYSVRPGHTRNAAESSLFFLIRDGNQAEPIAHDLIAKIRACGGSVHADAYTVVGPSTAEIATAGEWRNDAGSPTLATHGTIVVFRKRRSFVVDVEPEVIVASRGGRSRDRTVVAHLDNNTFVRIALPQGEYHISAPLGMGERITVTPGSVHFLRYDMSESAHHDVFLVPEATARKQGTGLKPLAPKKIFHPVATSLGDPFVTDLPGAGARSALARPSWSVLNSSDESKGAEFQRVYGPEWYNHSDSNVRMAGYVLFGALLPSDAAEGRAIRIDGVVISTEAERTLLHYSRPSENSLRLKSKAVALVTIAGFGRIRMGTPDYQLSYTVHRTTPAGTASEPIFLNGPAYFYGERTGTVQNIQAQFVSLTLGPATGSRGDYVVRVQVFDRLTNTSAALEQLFTVR